MPTIAFVTDAAHPTLHPGDTLAARALTAHGAEVLPVRWDDPAVAWGRFDLISLRTPWDYYRREGEFRAWLSQLAPLGARVKNPVPLVRWNMDKRYLADLARLGVPLPRTCWLSPAPQGETGAPGLSISGPDKLDAARFGSIEGLSLAEVLEASGLDEVVIKPSVSGNAYQTFRSNRAQAAADNARFLAQAQQMPLLVQAFVPEITRGEWSLIYFAPPGGPAIHSHTIRKHPATGDFRVQSDYGGRVTPETPPALVEEVARRTLAALPPLAEGWHYARVDLVESAQGPVLMELEMIEPELFFPYEEGAAARFADTLRAHLGALR